MKRAPILNFLNFKPVEWSFVAVAAVMLVGVFLYTNQPLFSSPRTTASATMQTGMPGGTGIPGAELLW